MKMAVAAAIAASIAASAVNSYLGLGLGWHGTTPARRVLGRTWTWLNAKWAGTARQGDQTEPARHDAARSTVGPSRAGTARPNSHLYAAQQHGLDVPAPAGLMHAACADDAYLQELIRGSIPGPSSARARVTPLSDEEIGRFYCGICMESKLMFDRFRTSDACAHEFCVACIVGHIEACVAEGAVPVPCPAGDCPDGGIMHPEACKKLLDIDVFDSWCVALCERAVGSARARCPYHRDCGELVVLDAGAGAAVSKAACSGCSRAFCLQCEEPWDGRHGSGGDGCVLSRLAEGRNWRRCPSRRAMIDKIDGCKRMVCRCGSVFCYDCGSSLREERCRCFSSEEDFLPPS